MQDATIERLSEIMSNSRPGSNNIRKGKNAPPRKHVFHLNLHLDEGWFSLFLVATVVYSTIWSVQAAGWVDHLNILSLTTAIGLVAGVIAAKQQRLPRLLVHGMAIALALLLAFWQTAGVFYDGNVNALANGMHRWVLLALSGGTSADDSIFLFFITSLGFALAYTSAWLVYRTRNPWLMITANAVVLLINLSNVEPGYIIYLAVFLMASLLLMLRFNLYDSVRRWRRQGLRYADDLGWDVMQAGAFISIAIIILSWLLPWGYTNDAASQIWTMDSNPWVQLEDTWSRIMSVSGGYNPANHGNFQNTLVLGGNPNLNNDIVFRVQSSDGSQYLESLSYDNYDGRQWVMNPTINETLDTTSSLAAESSYVHVVEQTVTVVNPPGEQQPFLLGAPQIASVDQSATAIFDVGSGSLVAVLAKNGKMVTGERYTIHSYASSAAEATLRTVPLPVNAPTFPANFDGQFPPTYYNPDILNTYLQLPKHLDANILATAQTATAGAVTMYDKALALEFFLRNNYKYDINARVPPGQESVAWFLLQSKRGYCTYFATAMAVMARSLGMPARIVSGYTNGQFDPARHIWIVRGLDAHTWTQIYFAGYGWINFEPSAGFSSFTRPTPQSISNLTLPPNLNVVKSPSVKNRRLGGGPSDIAPNSTSQAQAQLQWRQDTGIAFGSVTLLILFSLIFFGLWWRRLFRGYRLSMQIYGRICLLANWAGIELLQAQTPYESMQKLAEATPTETQSLERFGDIYVRELWADPSSAEHPSHTGEVRELPGLWKYLQPRLFLYVVRHPYFLRTFSSRLRAVLGSLRLRRADEDDEENLIEQNDRSTL